MDPRYIYFEFLRKVPATAVFGQVGEDSVGNGVEAAGVDGEAAETPPLSFLRKQESNKLGRHFRLA